MGDGDRDLDVGAEAALEIAEVAAQGAAVEGAALVEGAGVEALGQLVGEDDAADRLVLAGIAQAVLQRAGVARRLGAAAQGLAHDGRGRAQIGEADGFDRDPEDRDERQDHDDRDDEDGGQQQAPGEPRLAPRQGAGALRRRGRVERAGLGGDQVAASVCRVAHRRASFRGAPWRARGMIGPRARARVTGARRAPRSSPRPFPRPCCARR